MRRRSVYVCDTFSWGFIRYIPFPFAARACKRKRVSSQFPSPFAAPCTERESFWKLIEAHKSSSFTFLCWLEILLRNNFLSRLLENCVLLDSQSITSCCRNYSTLIVLWFYYVFLPPLLLLFFALCHLFFRHSRWKKKSKIQPKKIESFSFVATPKVVEKWKREITCKTGDGTKSCSLFCVK